MTERKIKEHPRGLTSLIKKKKKHSGTFIISQLGEKLIRKEREMFVSFIDLNKVQRGDLWNNSRRR